MRVDDEQAQVRPKSKTQPRKPLTWAERQERHAVKMAKRTPEQVVSYAYNLAVWHLSRQMQTVAEIRKRLTAKLVPEDVAEATIERLVAMGALDDRAYAESYARSSATFKKWGTSRIRRELASKGIDQEIIDEAIHASVDDEHDTTTALRVAEKKVKSTARESDPRKRRQKVVQAVVAKGFSFQVATTAADLALAGLDVEEN